MEKLLIEPGVGIGQIKLGMTRAEVDSIVEQYVYKYKKGTEYPIFFEYVFKIEYDKSGKVKFIEVTSDIKIFFKCICYEVDVFNTKADSLISRISQEADYAEDTSGETQYLFIDIGLSLWRASVLKEEDMQENWFKEMDVENQEEEKRYMFFQTIAVYPNDGLYYKGLI